MKLAEFAVARPITMVMATLSMIVLGVISLTRLPLESFPSISSLGVNVNVSYPSSSPEEVERDITRPLEESVALLGNIDRISATSTSSNSSVRVEFKAGTDMDIATMEVRERVEAVRGNLPADVRNVRIRRWQSDERPSVYANVAWRGQGDRLFDIYRKVIEPQLLRLDGVANVTVEGIEEKQLIVELDQQRLQDHDVSLPYLSRQVRDNNVNVSLGRVLDGGQRYQVRALGEFARAGEIGELPLAGTSLRLEDVGPVNYDYPEKKRYERLNGADAVTVEVYKSSTANLVDMAADVRAALEEIELSYGGDLEIEIVRDRSEQVLREVDKLSDSALLGAVLAVGIIFLFLRNIRSTLVISVAIPVSVLCVFTGLFAAREFFGSTVTLNMVTMTGLMLAVGMLVDPAVVTLESIFRRRQEEGAEPGEAALSGAREIGMAVIASSLTTMVVFIPFFFLSSSRMTAWMRDAGLAICLAVAVSTVVSLALIPLASSRLFKQRYDRFDRVLKGLVLLALLVLASLGLHELTWEGLTAWAGRTGSRLAERVAGMQWTTAAGLAAAGAVTAAAAWQCRRRGMRGAYVGLLRWTLSHRLATLFASALLMGTGIYLFMQLEQRGTPWTPERRVDISAEIDRNYSLDEVKAMFGDIEQRLLARAGELDIESLNTNFRQRRGRITARLVDADDGSMTTAEAGEAIKALLPETVGVTWKMGRRRSWQGNMLGVEVQLKGRDQDVLALLAEDIESALGQLPGVKDVDTSLEDGEEEIRVSVDREQALEYGLSPRDVATTISTALGTRRTSTFKAEDREIDLVLQLEEEDRVDLEQLKNSSFDGRDETRIQLAAVADFQVAEGPKNLVREDREHTMNIFANTENRMQAFGLMGSGAQHDGRFLPARGVLLGPGEGGALDAAGHPGQHLHAAVRAAAHLPDHGFAVRVADPPLHDHAGHPLLPHRRLGRPLPARRAPRQQRHPGAADPVRHRRQQRHRAGRSHQPLPPGGHGPYRGDPARRPEPPASDPDDGHDHRSQPDAAGSADGLRNFGRVLQALGSGRPRRRQRVDLLHRADPRSGSYSILPSRRPGAVVPQGRPRRREEVMPRAANSLRSFARPPGPRRSGVLDSASNQGNTP